MTTTARFEGVGGRLVAKVMVRRNRDTELEAIDVLGPSPADVVVAIGVGPGVGVQPLSTRVRRVIAVDPSQVMVEETRRRNRHAIDAGVVQVVRTDATQLPLAVGEADGAIAVNSMQLWEPLDASLAEVARVLCPGARLVALTHDWAIERSTGQPPEAGVADLGRRCGEVGLVDPRSWRAKSENGRSVAFTVTRSAAP